MIKKDIKIEKYIKDRKIDKNSERKKGGGIEKRENKM